MLNKNHKKTKQNFQVNLFVDSQCICCGYCWREAPGNFASHEQDAYAYVHQQPTSDSEIQNCQNILEACPVQAIGQEKVEANNAQNMGTAHTRKDPCAIIN